MNRGDETENAQRARKRAAALMAVIVSPVVLFVVAVRIVGPHDYPAGDIRNEALFWVAIGAFFLVVIGAMLIGSLRLLRKKDPSDPPGA